MNRRSERPFAQSAESSQQGETHSTENPKQAALRKKITEIIEKVKVEHERAADLRAERNKSWETIKECEATIAKGQKLICTSNGQKRDETYETLEEFDVMMRDTHNRAYETQSELDKNYSRVVKLLEKREKLEEEIQALGGNGNA